MQTLAEESLHAGRLLSELHARQQVPAEHLLCSRPCAKCWEQDCDREPANGLTRTIKPSVTMPCGEDVVQRGRMLTGGARSPVLRQDPNTARAMGTSQNSLLFSVPGRAGGSSSTGILECFKHGYISLNMLLWRRVGRRCSLRPREPVSRHPTRCPPPGRRRPQVPMCHSWGT